MLHRRPRSPETWAPRGPLPTNCSYTINRSHWAAAGLLGVWLLGRGVPQNLVTGEIAEPINDHLSPFHPPLARVGPIGPAQAYEGTGGTARWQVRPSGILAGRSTWTIAAVVAQLDGSSSGGGGFPIYSERSAATPILKLESRNNLAGATFRNDSSQLIQLTAGSTMANGLVRAPVATMRPGGTGRLFRVYDGVSAFSQFDWGTRSMALASTGSFIGAEGVTSTAAWRGDIALVAISADGWEDAQMQEWALAPYRILIPAG